jgi:hypothetical protein
MEVFMRAVTRAAERIVRLATAKGSDLVARMRRSAEEARRHREKVEQELFRGRYHLSSKNDDDLPIVR